MRITVWDPSRKVNHLSKVVRDRKVITEFTRSISTTRKGYPVLTMDVSVSKDNTLVDGLIEKISSMLDEMKSKTVHKDEEGDW